MAITRGQRLFWRRDAVGTWHCARSRQYLCLRDSAVRSLTFKADGHQGTMIEHPIKPDGGRLCLKCLRGINEEVAAA